MINAILVHIASVIHEIGLTPSAFNIVVFMAPNDSLNIPEKIRMVTNAGTAHGKISNVRIMSLPFNSFWFTKSARKTLSAICKVVATNVQIMVQAKTFKKVSRQTLIVNNFLKFARPIQSVNAAGQLWYKS